MFDRNSLKKEFWTQIIIVKTKNLIAVYSTISPNGNLNSFYTETIYSKGYLYIGQNPFYPKFDGSIDNLQIYNKQISNLEIGLLLEGGVINS